ncbi:uncharacterized protein [Paralichthys olivaceus]|uniref:uncharacterized protein isoform X2 n=1 Tax=Paralichthys olivaceus TaxID=8255 RepID=UPI0037514D5C
MEKWLKQSTLVLLTVAVMVVSGKVYVNLDKKQKVDVPFGSSLTLHCCLGLTDEDQRFRVRWSFISSESANNKSINISEGTFSRNSSDEWRNLILSDVTRNNSGRYFCEIMVDIPKISSNKSKETQVVIVKSLMEATVYPSLVTNDPTPIDWWMWILLGISTFILIILLVICAMMRRRCHRRREDQIYANTHPVPNKQPSPRPRQPVNSLKKHPSSENFWTPGTNRTYANGKWRQKQ